MSFEDDDFVVVEHSRKRSAQCDPESPHRKTAKQRRFHISTPTFSSLCTRLYSLFAQKQDDPTAHNKKRLLEKDTLCDPTNVASSFQSTTNQTYPPSIILDPYGPCLPADRDALVRLIRSSRHASRTPRNSHTKHSQRDRRKAVERYVSPLSAVAIPKSGSCHAIQDIGKAKLQANHKTSSSTSGTSPPVLVHDLTEDFESKLALKDDSPIHTPTKSPPRDGPDGASSSSGWSIPILFPFTFTSTKRASPPKSIHGADGGYQSTLGASHFMSPGEKGTDHVTDHSSSSKFRHSSSPHHTIADVEEDFKVLSLDENDTSFREQHIHERDFKSMSRGHVPTFPISSLHEDTFYTIQDDDDDLSFVRQDKMRHCSQDSVGQSLIQRKVPSLQSSQVTISSYDSRESTVQSTQSSSVSQKTRNHPCSKQHIFEKQHKAATRRRTKQAVKNQLYQILRTHRRITSGHLGGSELGLKDYERLLRYHNVDNSLRLLPRPTSPRRPLRLDKESGTPLSMQRTLDNAKATLASPKPLKPWNPDFEQLEISRRMKDEAIERRRRPPLPANLPPEDERAVTYLLLKSGVVAKFAREQVSDGDIARLRPGQWLNDEIINFYGAMILARSGSNKENIAKVNGKTPDKGLLDVHYFSSFFWSKLTKEGYEQGRLAKWTKRLDIFSKDVVLLPVNHSNAHWTAAAINFRQRRIESYDSMGMAKNTIFKYLREYVDAEHRNKKKKPFDFTGWDNWAPDDVPQQENGFDCGVFTCHFLEAISRGEESFVFSQKDMTYLRRRMIWEIGNAQLRHSDYS